MANMQNHEPQANSEEFRLPEWETTARHRGDKHAETNQTSSVRERAFILIDRIVPSHRKYFGFSRKVICIALLIVILVILALILGLAIGLSKKTRYASAPVRSLRACSPNRCSVTIEISLWDRKLTQVISLTTVLDLALAVLLLLTPTTSYPSVTLHLTQSPKAPIRMRIHCAGTS